MHYGAIKYNDIANGEGVRVSLFVSGCTNRCTHCFQKQTWDFEYGEPFTKEVEDKIINGLAKSYVKGLTVLGGEPMEVENQRALLPFLKRVREELPDKTIWLYTGNTYEELTSSPGTYEKAIDITRELIDLVDILVDGRFEEEKKSLGLRFRGSTNQRIIDIRKTMKLGEIVLWEGSRFDRTFVKEEDKNET